MNLFFYQLKQAYLSLKQKPGFVFSVVTTMGITLGALLCVLTLAYVMLLKPLPYPEEDKLYIASNELINAKGNLMFEAFSYPALMALYHQDDLFSKSALVAFNKGVLLSQKDLPMVEATFVSPQWFSLTAMPMAIGRTFESSENVNSHNPVAIISYETWQEKFSADKNILGRKVNFDNVSYQIIGVVAENYIEPQVYAYHRGANVYRKTQLWLPWDFNNTQSDVRKTWWLTTSGMLVGKLPATLTVKQAEAHVSSVINEKWLAATVGDKRFKGMTQRIALHDFKKVSIGDNRKSVYFLLAGIVGLVIIAFTNITNLMTSRAFMQQRMMAIQAAVGAKSSTLFNMIFCEALLLVFSSIIVGIFITSLGFYFIEQYLTTSLARSSEMSINGFTLISSVVLLFSFAWTFAKISVSSMNKKILAVTINSSGKGTGSQLPKLLRQLLITCQIAVACVLVFISFNLFKTAIDTINSPSYLDVNRVMALKLAPTKTVELNTESALAELNLIQQKLAQLPEVETVSHSASPFSFFDNWLSGLKGQGTNEKYHLRYRIIDEQYFSLLKQSLTSGDNFTAEDVQNLNNVMIVNDVLANEMGDKEEIIGKKVFFRNDRIYTIIGVVKGIRVPGENNIINRAYIPRSAVYDLRVNEKMSMLIKLNEQQQLTRQQVIEIIKSISSSFSVDRLETLDDIRYQKLFNQITTALITALVSLLSLILAGIGIYGILSYSIEIRRFEIGTRMAIGAKGKDIITLVFKENAGALVVGIVASLFILLGLYLSFSEALTSYISLELLPIFIITLALISLLSFFACYLPLRQYINKPAIHSLRGEG